MRLQQVCPATIAGQSWGYRAWSAAGAKRSSSRSDETRASASGAPRFRSTWPSRYANRPSRSRRSRGSPAASVAWISRKPSSELLQQRCLPHPAFLSRRVQCLVVGLAARRVTPSFPSPTTVLFGGVGVQVEAKRDASNPSLRALLGLTVLALVAQRCRRLINGANACTARVSTLRPKRLGHMERSRPIE